MDLFSIPCTTCGARLKVRSLAAIGQIFACPKCQSMVQITPPPGWKPPEVTPPSKPKPSGHQSPAAARDAGIRNSASRALAAVSIADSDFRVGREENLDAAPEQQLPKESATLCLHQDTSTRRRWTLAALSLGALVFGSASLWSLISSSDSDPNVRVAAPLAVAESEPEQPTPDPTSPASTETEPPPIPLSIDPAEPLATPELPQESRADATSPAAVEPRPAAKPVENAVTRPKLSPTASPLFESTSNQALSAEDRRAIVKLDERIPSIRFEGAKLSDLLQFLSRMTAVPIDFAEQTLLEAGIDEQQPVSVELADTSVAKVLKAVLAPTGLQYSVEEGRVVISVAEKK